ncbi:hypothetical protein MEQU1_002920 [Malassezia equina]|uniref:RanBD1 domain-containing protein n=1 Tax=Malassezia equina TaxID=1381935 RepID=A0AAF0EEQ3_9BASI|nr:hypothetical protein MEQU1_002920 [Malassezia equina]
MGDRDVGGIRRSQSLVSGLLSWMSPFRPSTSSPDTSMDEQPFSDAPSAEVAPPAPTSPTPAAPAAASTGAAPAPMTTDVPALQPSPYARRAWPATQAPTFHPGSFETPTKRSTPALKTTSPFAANVSPGRRHAPIYLGPGTSTRKSYSPLRSSLASTHSMSALAQQRPPMLAREPAATPEKRLKTSTTSMQALDQVAFASPSTSALPSSASVSSPRKRPVDEEATMPVDHATESASVEVPVRRSARHTRAASTMREVLDAMKPLEPPKPAVPEVINPYQTRSKSTVPRPSTRSTRARALEAARQRAASEAPAADEPPKTSLLDMVERTEPLPLSPRRSLHSLRPPASPEGKSSVEGGALRLMANKPKRPSPLSMGATPIEKREAPMPAPAAEAPAPVAAAPAATRPIEPAAPLDVPSWCVITAPARRTKPTTLSGAKAEALDVAWEALPVFSFDIPAAQARSAPPTTQEAAPAASTDTSMSLGSSASSAPKEAPSLFAAPAKETSTSRPAFSFGAAAKPTAPFSLPSASQPPASVAPISEPSASKAPAAAAEAPAAEAPASEEASTSGQGEASALTACGQGEEDEVTSHEVRAKIWRLDAGAWQDMGVSILRIKTAKDTHKSRVLARNAVNGHVVLNFVLYQGLQVMCDKNVLTFLGFVDAKPCHLRCKVKTQDAAASLKEALMQYAQADES